MIEQIDRIKTLPGLDGFEIKRRFAFPERINTTNLRHPRQEELDALSLDYPFWSAIEIRQLYYFRQVYQGNEADYSLDYCAICQKDRHYYHKDTNQWWYRRPKAKIPYRLFIDCCFRNIYIVCEECREAGGRISMKELKRQMGMPEKFLDADFANWDTDQSYKSELLRTAKDYVNNYEKESGLLICGDAGTGKTRLVCMIMNAIHTKHPEKTKLFVFMPTLAKAGRKELNSKVYETVDLLCIDEITKESIGMEFAQYIYPIVQIRYENNKPTLITSNIDRKDWISHENMYCQRIGDRFKDFVYRSTFGHKSQRGVSDNERKNNV